jgi:hypothetical protein
MPGRSRDSYLGCYVDGFGEGLLGAWIVAMGLEHTSFDPPLVVVEDCPPAFVPPALFLVEPMCSLGC